MNAKNNAEQFKKLKNLSGLKKGESGANCKKSRDSETCATEQPENENDVRTFAENEYLGFKKTLRQINEDFSKELSEDFSAENNEICVLQKEDDLPADCELNTAGDLPAEGDLSTAGELNTAGDLPVDCDLTTADKTNAAGERNLAESTDSIIGGDTGRLGGADGTDGADIADVSDGTDGAAGEAFEVSDSEIENERYRSEFNEFRYARYMGFVIADMRRVYGAGKITAALSDFESEKPYAYAFTTRGLGVAGSYIKSVRKSLKKSRGAQKNLAVAASDGSGSADTCNAANAESSYNAGGKNAKKTYALPRACAVIGGEGADSALLITLKEIRLAKKLGASEITVFVSPSVAALGNKKAIKSEIKALKRACFNKIFKLGVNIGELTQLQAENVITVGSALKIKSFTLYGNGAFFKLKRLKSLAPNARFEVYSQVNSARALSELIEGGADKIHTPHLTELSRSVREAFKNVKV